MQKSRQNCRKNGCAWPWHPYQVISWLVGGFTALAVCTFVPTLLPAAYQVYPKQVIYAVLASVFLLTVVVFAAILTASDPTDSVVQQCRKAKQQK